MELQNVLSSVVHNRINVEFSNFAFKDEDEFIKYKYFL